ncbi:MAG: site-2 protease family protein [Bacillota bacterium]|nr:site-2 protease family protein [Bacillota bacterium]
MDFIINKILVLPGIIIGLTFHEYAHAKTASVFGDNTAKNEGRVSLNPMRHLDIIGFLCLIIAGFGWGKPVPVNSYNITGKNRKFKEVMISAAGVIMNFFVALIFAVVLVGVSQKAPQLFASEAGNYLYYALYYICYINIVLMIFNLIPIPPLDGFNIVAEISSFNETELYWKLLRYGSFILILLLVTNVIDYILTPGINGVFNLINMILKLIF